MRAMWCGAIVVVSSAVAVAKTTTPPTWRVQCVARFERAVVDLVAIDSSYEKERPQANAKSFFLLSANSDRCASRAFVHIFDLRAKEERPWRARTPSSDKDSGDQCGYRETQRGERNTKSRSAIIEVSVGPTGATADEAYAILQRAADDCLAMP